MKKIYQNKNTKNDHLIRYQQTLIEKYGEFVEIPVINQNIGETTIIDARESSKMLKRGPFKKEK